MRCLVFESTVRLLAHSVPAHAPSPQENVAIAYSPEAREHQTGTPHRANEPRHGMVNKRLNITPSIRRRRESYRTDQRLPRAEPRKAENVAPGWRTQEDGMARRAWSASDDRSDTPAASSWRCVARHDSRVILWQDDQRRWRRKRVTVPESRDVGAYARPVQNHTRTMPEEPERMRSAQHRVERRRRSDDLLRTFAGAHLGVVG